MLKSYSNQIIKFFSKFICYLIDQSRKMLCDRKFCQLSNALFGDDSYKKLRPSKSSFSVFSPTTLDGATI